MADPSFETDLERLFDSVEAAPDADRFARAVDARLDRLLRLRRWVYGVFGGAGALVAGWQITQWQGWDGLGRWFKLGSDAAQGAANVVASSATATPPTWDTAGVTWFCAALGAAALSLYLALALREN